MQRQIENNSERNSMNMDSPSANVVQRILVIIVIFFVLFFVLLAGVEQTYSEDVAEKRKAFLAEYGQ